MPNEPKPAKEHRSKPPRHQNAQDNHEGSSHKPEEFDAMNPAKIDGKPDDEVQEQV